MVQLNKPPSIKFSLQHAHSLHYKRALICNVTYCAMFLTLSLVLSLFEIPTIYLPFGVQFSFRLFDTLMLFFALPTIGIWYTLSVAAILPWAHLMVDGQHSPISMVGFMLNNIVCVILVYLVYFRIGRIHISQSSKIKQAQAYKNYLESYSKPLFWQHIKYKLQYFSANAGYRFFKFFNLGVLSILCATAEAASYIFVLYMLLNGLSNPDQENPILVTGYISPTVILIIWSLLSAIFLGKYIIEFILFGIMQKRFMAIKNYSSA